MLLSLHDSAAYLHLAEGPSMSLSRKAADTSYYIKSGTKVVVFNRTATGGPLSALETWQMGPLLVTGTTHFPLHMHLLLLRFLLWLHGRPFEYARLLQ